jgi:threonine dehydrogenase-like Zn-dependent dehydrogenase
MTTTTNRPATPADTTMTGAYLPGDSSVRLAVAPVPTPGHGEVLLRVKSSTICGSDIRAIYRQHLGKGPEGYQGVIAGHEPCGQVVQAGPGCRRFGPGDRVVVYHISGCGLCWDCRRGYMISCSSSWRRAYGWQRDGGMAEWLLAEEKDLIALPDALSYTDGAQVACGFGTAYEGLTKIGVSGDDRVLVTGLGPVGLAAAALARKMGARTVFGIDVIPDRLELATRLGLCDEVLLAAEDNVADIRRLTGGNGVERAVDASGNGEARATAVRAAGRWGRIVLLGEGGDLQLTPSPDMLHEQKTVFGSWVTSTWLMEDLLDRLVAWGLHPAELVTDRFPLEKAGDAYALMASGRSGKIAVCFDEELEG